MKKQLSTEEKYTLLDFKYKVKTHRSTIWATVGALVGFLSVAVYIICHLALSDETVSEIYTDKIFYYINLPFRKIAEFVPFSVAELLLYIAIACLIVFLIKTIYATVAATVLYFRMKKSGHYPEKRTTLRATENFALRMSAALCFVVAIFILFGGINYTGETFAQRADYELGGYTVGQLKQLCLYLGQGASYSRKAVKKNPSGIIDNNSTEYNPYNLAEDAKLAYSRLPREYNSYYTHYPAVKFAYSSQVMSNLHITGIYPYVFPEAVVNINTPIMSLPHTICHEMAHQRGFAREDEANFIAFMACLESGNPLFVYSAYYTGFTYAMGELYCYDQVAWEQIMNMVDKEVKADISREKTYWRQFETVSNEFTSSVNDTYLNIMNVQDGVQNYGRMVELLLAEAVRSGIIQPAQ